MSRKNREAADYRELAEEMVDFMRAGLLGPVMMGTLVRRRAVVDEAVLEAWERRLKILRQSPLSGTAK